MKPALRSKAYWIVCMILSVLVTNDTKASEHRILPKAVKPPSFKAFSINQERLSTDSVNFVLVNSIVVDSEYKIQLLSDTVSLRFHFKLIKSDTTTYQSGNLTADFSISNGFISVFDSQRVALILIDKIKAGGSLVITKADLEAHDIPAQN